MRGGSRRGVRVLCVLCAGASQAGAGRRARTAHCLPVRQLLLNYSQVAVEDRGPDGSLDVGEPKLEIVQDGLGQGRHPRVAFRNRLGAVAVGLSVGLLVGLFVGRGWLEIALHRNHCDTHPAAAAGASAAAPGKSPPSRPSSRWAAGWRRSCCRRQSRICLAQRWGPVSRLCVCVCVCACCAVRVVRAHGEACPV